MSRALSGLGGLALFSIALVAACGPANYPDRSAVEAAQRSWCDALAKAAGAGASWERGTWERSCKGAYPTASAGYLKGMAKCFPAHKESYGAKAPDAGHLVAECNDEITAKMTVDDAAFAEAIEARCERAARCEKVPAAECAAAVKKLDGAQRALLYGIYNASALHTVSDCLRSSACGTDEDQARAACYKQVEGGLIWFPN
jgi:hypothetical protein